MMKSMMARVALLCILAPYSATAASPSREDAQALMRSGKAVEALPILEQISQAYPKDLDLLCERARALSWLNRYAEAESLYVQVLAQDTKHREALLGQTRLRSYQGKNAEALAIVNTLLQSRPGDQEILDLKLILDQRCRDKDCGQWHRFTVGVNGSHEAYSATDPGNGMGFFFQDRAFHGWSAALSADYLHRFKLDDVDLGLTATHALGRRGAYGGASMGGATRGVILPTARFALLGGVPLGHGLLFESEGLYRHYSNANTYSFSPTLSLSRYAWTLSAGYGVSYSAYTSGARAKGLSSYKTRLAYDGYCRLRPWVGYSRSREPFEAGFTGTQDFVANHYLVGVKLWIAGGWHITSAWEYEDRPDLQQHIKRYNVGLTYSWGNPDSSRR